jgi:hypothetical protein
VGEQASPDEIKKAYYRMAFLYHPDRNQDPQAPQVFDQIKKAFDILTDPARVRLVNQSHVKDQLAKTVVDGLQITFGSFFGYRLFRFPGVIDRRLRLGQEKPGESDAMPGRDETFREGQSILDHPAYDSLELVYAGRFSKEDEAQLVDSFSGQNVLALPWVTVNHRGIYHFLRGEWMESLRCYEQLNQRIPNNIIFMYRLGILEVILGFRDQRPNWLGIRKPNRRQVRRGIRWLEHCLKIANSRPVGRQKCLVIRKTLAEIWEQLGSKRRSRKLWKEIQASEPRSLEAAFHLGGWSRAQELLQSKRRHQLQRLESAKELSTSATTLKNKQS